MVPDRSAASALSTSGRVHKSELLGNHVIADEPGSIRADDDAGKEVADDGRQPEPLGQVAKDEGRRQADGNREHEVHSDNIHRHARRLQSQ